MAADMEEGTVGMEDLLVTPGADILAGTWAVDAPAEVTLGAAMSEARDTAGVMSWAAHTLAEVIQLSFIAVRLTVL